jgi:hypothetical protein
VNLPSFTQNLMQTPCSIIAIHYRQNETRSRKITRIKTMRVHSALSRGRVRQQAFGSVTLASTLIFSHRDSYNNNSPGTFRYHLVQIPVFLTSVLDGQIHAPAAFRPVETAAGTHWTRGWMDPKSAWTTWRRKILPLPGLEIRLFVHPL